MKKLFLWLLALTVVSSAEAVTKTVAFEVTGWTCGSCAASTKIALKKLEGVENVQTDLKSKEVVVVYDDTRVEPERMIQAIERVGYKAKIKAAAATSTEQVRVGKSASGEAASSAERPAERVSFFEVPLGCLAAESLGCGSMAKPILRELEGKDGTSDPRINYPGTVLAVVWKDPARSGSGRTIVEEVFTERELETSVLLGSAREKALEEFATERWYRAEDVDRLSEREAEVIAARLVGRLGLPKERSAALKKDLSAAIAKQLTSESEEECGPGRREVEFTEVARKHLNKEEMAELRKAAEQGITALPGEAR